MSMMLAPTIVLRLGGVSENPLLTLSVSTRLLDSPYNFYDRQKMFFQKVTRD
jgi:hypothetical protein